MTTRLVPGVPAHLRSNGPFAALLPKSQAVTADLLAQFQAYEAARTKQLSPAHIAAIDTWLAGQSDAEPEIGKARAPELKSYLRQVTASTIVAGDKGGVARVAKAAFVMAIGDDPRDATWRLLRYPAQAAERVSAEPGEMLATIAREIGPPAAQMLETNWRFIQRMDPLPVTLHQPSGLPLLEPAWDPEENAKRLGLTAWRLDKPVSPYSLPWDVPLDAYVDATTSTTASEYEFVDALNRFLVSGSATDAATVVADATSNRDALPWAIWAATFWHGDRWPIEFPELVEVRDRDLPGEPGSGLVAIARGGTAQVSWTLA